VLSRLLRRAPTATAPFRDDPSARERLDWRLLQHGAVTLYHKRPILEAHSAWLRQMGYRVYGFDCSRWDSARAMHEDLKRVLGFPAHYAHNLASLIDTLAELEVAPDGGCALQLLRYDAFAGRDRELAQTLLDLVETTSRGFLLTGRRFLALVQSDDARIKFERVGARPVNWNPQEWTDADRGLRRGGEQNGG
jgi:hypothetical protein